MAFYSPEEMKEIFERHPKYKDMLYIRGFLISNVKYEVTEEYPFYGNWNTETVESEGLPYYIYTNKHTYSYTYDDGRRTFFLIGHAYNPFTMEYQEDDILRSLSKARKESMEKFWDKESELTGVFCVGYFSQGNVYYSTDCCGMQLVYHGTVDGNFYLTSHSKLVADLTGIQQTKYIDKLVNDRFWHYFGTWLPADLSPVEELRRLVPNCAGKYDHDAQKIRISRYYPLQKVEMIYTQQDYDRMIAQLGDIMHANMELIAKKWPEKKISISVTGGRDSMSCMACTNGLYDKFSYFSYISNPDEAVDADASEKILADLGLTRELYEIPEDYEEYANLDDVKKIMECNAGCIGHNNENDVKKRLYFYFNPPCDIEVKSWVNEMGRGWYFNKYNKKKFPKYPNASYLRAMHKVYLNPWLIHYTDKAFRRYLRTYYNKQIFDNLSWLDLHFWEFSWSGGEGVFLTSEHRVSYEITVPFNNRKYVDLMVRVPGYDRKDDCIPNDLIDHMDSRINKAGVKIKDVSHTDMRALIVRIYMEILSKVRF